MIYFRFFNFPVRKKPSQNQPPNHGQPPGPSSTGRIPTGPSSTGRMPPGSSSTGRMQPGPSITGGPSLGSLVQEKCPWTLQYRWTAPWLFSTGRIPLDPAVQVDCPLDPPVQVDCPLDPPVQEECP